MQSHFVLFPKTSKQIYIKEGVLYKFKMKLDTNCTESDIYISNSYIDGIETKSVGFIQNN